jgi:hypothetical protein
LSRRWTPLASGSVFVIYVALKAVALFFPESLPDEPPGDIRKQIAAVRSLTSESREGVHIEIPHGWSVVTFSPAPQVVAPFAGADPIRVARPWRALAAAGRTEGYCDIILERDTIRLRDLDEEAAAIKRTVAGITYERNAFDWFVSDRKARWKLLIRTSDDLLHNAPLLPRTIDLKLVTDARSFLGGLQARKIGYSAKLNARESAGLIYVLAHRGQWQYTLIGILGDPTRRCTIDFTWIQEHVTFDVSTFRQTEAEPQ